MRTSFDESLLHCRGAIGEAIDGEIAELKAFLTGTYGYQGHKPGKYAQKPEEPKYFDEEAQDAVQEYIEHVVQPQTVQASGAIEWLGQRKENEKAASSALIDEITDAQNARATHEADAFGETVDGLVASNADLAASLLSEIQAAADAIIGSLEQLKHEHWSYVDVHGYRYKLLKQLHHQREAFEQAVNAAWLTWTQAREHAVQDAAAGAAAGAESFESFLANQLGKWEADAAATRSDVAGAIGAKGDALKGSIQEAARAFAEKQIYKRKFIEQVDDAYKAKALTAKVDLEDKLFQEAVKGIWATFTEEAAGVEAWLGTFLDGEGDGLAASQDAVGAALADALADKLDDLGSALGEVGDALETSKKAEIEKVMQALYGYGYDSYKPGYVPVLKKAAEVIAVAPVIVHPVVVPQPKVIVPVAVAPVHSHVHVAHVHHPKVIAHAPEEESEESVESVETEVAEESVEEVEETRPAAKQVSSGEVFVEGEDPYVTFEVEEESEEPEPVEESEESESADHYAAAAPVIIKRQPVYRPVVAGARQAALAHHYVDVDSYSSSDDEPNVTINIFNGNGAVQGFGTRLECQPREGECRPQCPEVIYNDQDNSLWFTW